MSQPGPYDSPYDLSRPAAAGTDVFAILGLVFAILFWPLGLVFSLMARSRIKRTGAGGRGLATAGLIISIVFGVIGVLTSILLIVAAAHSGSTSALG